MLFQTPQSLDNSMTHMGRAVAGAVSYRLPTNVIHVGSRVRSYGICSGQSGTGASFI
jgi:hypothetical protein